MIETFKELKTYKKILVLLLILASILNIIIGIVNENLFAIISAFLILGNVLDLFLSQVNDDLIKIYKNEISIIICLINKVLIIINEAIKNNDENSLNKISKNIDKYLNDFNKLNK